MGPCPCLGGDQQCRLVLDWGAALLQKPWVSWLGSKEGVSAGNPAAQEADCDLGCPHEAVKQPFEESHNSMSGYSIQFWTYRSAEMRDTGAHDMWGNTED